MKRLLADAQMTANGISTALDLIDSSTQNLTDDGRLPFAAIDQYFGLANLVLATPDGSKFAKGSGTMRALVAADLPTSAALLSRDPQTFTGTNKFQRLATADTSVATLVNGANQNLALPSAGVVRILTGALTLAWTLGGIVAPATDGEELDLLNLTGQTGTLNHIDGGSAAGNQFVCPGGANLAFPAATYGCITVRYSATIGAWFVRSHN